MPPQVHSQTNTSASPRSSATPLLASDQQHLEENTIISSKEGGVEKREPKQGKWKFLGRGKKKEEKEQQQRQQQHTAPMAAPGASVRPASPVKPLAMDLKAIRTAQSAPDSPSRYADGSAAAKSPSRLISSSPRLHSPASTEIFERSVQEPVQISTLHGELSPAHIPSHVITEDHIPPALEASAQAITSEELNPDEVEIVTTTSHQPAAASVLEGSSSHTDLTQLHAPVSPFHNVTSEPSDNPSLPSQSIVCTSDTDADADAASNYGQLDPNDVRRLSFISFADVVQSEHQQPPQSSVGLAGELGSRDSLHISSLPSSFKGERAASPLRSPRSPRSVHSQSMGSGGVTTPPPGMGIKRADSEASPVRSVGMGSPMSLPHGDLTRETIRQAVRRTASGELPSGGNKSAATSPIIQPG